jgi:sigma-B regulation protein RsbU (phosphoserine phosphatase)
MFDQPIVFVKSADSNLDFFDDEMKAFSNRQVYNGAVDALLKLEPTPANVIICEIETGEMTGIELAEAIRDIDRDRNHFTYIILIGVLTPQEVESEAFRNNVDVITSTARPDLLKHLIIAGCRISKRMNDLSSSRAALARLARQLRKGQLLDPLTGLGNRSFAVQTLQDSIRQIESRGGAAVFLMISIQNYDAIKKEFNVSIADELVVSISDRIQALVRPMDAVTYFAPGQFALVIIQPSIEQVTTECYQRLYEGVKLKSYTTTAGFQPVELAMSICAGTAETGPPKEEKMISAAVDKLDESFQNDCIVISYISEEL